MTGNVSPFGGATSFVLCSTNSCRNVSVLSAPSSKGALEDASGAKGSL
jgi:hypothetical protein